MEICSTPHVMHVSSIHLTIEILKLAKSASGQRVSVATKSISITLDESHHENLIHWKIEWRNLSGGIDRIVRSRGILDIGLHHRSTICDIY